MAESPYSDVPVNLDDEIRKMAARDGITYARGLETILAVTRKMYYEATIRAYYQGRDAGYAEGVRMMGSPIRRRIRAVSVISAGLGAALAAAATYFLGR